MEIAEAFVTIKVDNARFKRDLAQSSRLFDKTADKIKKRADKMKRAMRDASIAVIGLGVAMTASFGLLAKSLITAAATMEKLKFGLVAVAGGAKEANKQFITLREVAKLPGLTFQEAVQGSINLQAAGLSAKLAERSLKAFGNALVTVGRSAADLRGVNLALTQILTKQTGFGQEIRQLSERLPQVRVAMKEAFGISSSEDFKRLGLNSQEFVEGLVAQFEKLPRVTGGAVNAIDNLRDSWMQMANSLGMILLPAFTKITNSLADLTKFIEGLTDTQRSILAWTTVAGAGFGLVATAIGGLGLLLPKIITGIAGLSGVFGSLGTVALGPIGIGIAAIAVAIAGTAIALKEFGKARKDVRIEEDLKALEGNIAGIESQISLLNKAIGEIDTAVRKKGVKAISLLGTSLKNAAGDVPVLGKEIRTVAEQVDLITKRIAGLTIELDFLRKTPKGFGLKVDEPVATGFSKEEKRILRVIDMLKVKFNLEMSAQKEALRVDRENKRRALEATTRIGVPDLRGITQEEILKQGARRVDDLNKQIADEQTKRQAGLLAKFREFAAERRENLKRLLGIAKKAADDRDRRRDAQAAKDKARFQNLAEEEITTMAEVNEAVRKGNAEANKIRVAKNLNTLRIIKNMEQERFRSLAKIWNDFTGDFQSSFTNMFADILTKGRASWSSFAKDLKNIFLRQLAEIAVSQAFRGLFELLNRLDRGVFRPPATPDFGGGPVPPDIGSAIFDAPAAQGTQLAPAAPGINVILPFADVQHMSSARIEMLIRKQFEPATRNLVKRGILPRRM